MGAKTVLALVISGVLCVSGCMATGSSIQQRTQGRFSTVLGDTDVISDNKGGDVQEFLSAAGEIIAAGRKVRIDGICASACAVFADKIRPNNVCITDKAQFWFHMETRKDALFSMSPYSMAPVRKGTIEYKEKLPLSPDIMSWVESRGGLPVNGKLVMNAKEAKKFWPMCE